MLPLFLLLLILYFGAAPMELPDVELTTGYTDRGLISMTAQQISDLNTIATIIQIVTSCGQFWLALFAITVAYREFKKWRVELLGSKKIELALKLGKAAIAIRDGFRDARNPVRAIVHAPEYRPDSTNGEKKKQDEEYDFNQRLQRLLERLEPLYEIRWEISVLFDEDESIEEQVKLYNAKFHELQNAMYAIFSGKPTEKVQNIVSAGFSGTDDFGKEIDAITSKLLELARRYAA